MSVPAKKKILIRKPKDLVDVFPDIVELKIIIPDVITPSKLQTKEWRKSQDWYKGGKRTECDLYQRYLIKKITSVDKVNNTGIRLNIHTHELRKLSNFSDRPDGFDWTEDFDGYIESYHMYINLKMVCDKGGIQTRSLREVYAFIQAQLNHLLLDISKKPFFINLLDGDTSFSFIDKFNYFLSLDEYKEVKKYVFVGDMHTFREWFTGKQFLKDN